MRRDLIIGLLASLAVHVGVFYGSTFFKSRPPPPKKPTVELVPAMTMPPLPPPDDDTDQDQGDQNQKDQIAPPTQEDIPQIETSPFTQQIEPPVPTDVAISHTAFSIPQGTRDWKRGLVVFNPQDLDKQPSPIYQVQPEFPYELKKEGIEGYAEVRFIVSSTGTTRDVYATESSRHEFEQPAIQAVERWKFRPGVKAGRPVNTNMIIRIAFNLNDGD